LILPFFEGIRTAAVCRLFLSMIEVKLSSAYEDSKGIKETLYAGIV